MNNHMPMKIIWTENIPVQSKRSMILHCLEKYIQVKSSYMKVHLLPSLYQEKPRSFLNHHQHEKHQQDHANVNCPECNQLFSAKRNLKRHVRIKHKTVEANISRNSNESNPDENFNSDDTDIHNVAFQMGS